MGHGLATLDRPTIDIMEADNSHRTSITTGFLATYQPQCSCGWRSSGGYDHRERAQMAADRHVAQQDHHGTVLNYPAVNHPVAA